VSSAVLGFFSQGEKAVLTMNKPDPLEEALEKVGIHLEKKEVSPITQMLAGGVGGILGSVAGGMLGLGWIGKAFTALGGSIVGHVGVSYRFHYQPPRKGEVVSQAEYSTRR
jgi:hypothetical protein